MKNLMLGLMKNFKAKYGIQIRYTHCNISRENVDFEWAWKKKGMRIKFEYTAPSAPQQNGQVEQKFATLFNRVYVMLTKRKFSAFLRNDLCADAANTATLL